LAYLNRRTFAYWLSASFNLIADHAANYGATHRSACAAAGEYSAHDCSCAGTNCCVLVPRRHFAASAQAEQYHYGNRIDCETINRFHWDTF
jgi:hypothetical protein